MRRERCPGKWVDKGVDGVFVFACALAIAVAAASVAGGLSGCIRVSPHFEVVDCVERFHGCRRGRRLLDGQDLTVDRPGWERAIEAVAPAWSRWRRLMSSDRETGHFVRIVSETGAAFGVGVSVTGGGAIDFDNQTKRGRRQRQAPSQQERRIAEYGSSSWCGSKESGSLTSTGRLPRSELHLRHRSSLEIGTGVNLVARRSRVGTKALIATGRDRLIGGDAR